MPDPGYRSPLVDFFFRGEVARDVRLLAARGILAPGPLEQLALLVLLADDPDPEVAVEAQATIGAIPDAALSAFLARGDVSADIRAFFAARGVQPAAVAAPDSEEPLITAEPAAEGEGAEAQEDPKLLAALSVSERIKLAMRGTREQRGTLIHDANRLVAAAVLSSPKLSETEVEAFARMGNVSEEVLRIIGTNRRWLKSYSIIASLTRNPKTPLALSMRFLNRLVERDLKFITTDRSVPETVRLSARKLLTKPKHG